MPFKDFKRRWTICDVAPESDECPEHVILIDGEEDNPRVTCLDSHMHLYIDSTYHSYPSEKIEGPQYTIILLGKNPATGNEQISCLRKADPRSQTPSWTAEDKG